MSRLIDADALTEGFKVKRTLWLSVDEVMDEISDAPTIEAEPVRHGKWIDENCSICGQYVYHGDVRNYCPNCGARMEMGD